MKEYSDGVSPDNMESQNNNSNASYIILKEIMKKLGEMEIRLRDGVYPPLTNVFSSLSLTEEQIQNTPPLVLITILNRLENILQGITEKIPYLLVEDAVSEFHKQHLIRVKEKTRKSYITILARFQSDFKGRNLADSADITPDNIIEFIEKHYANCTANTRALNFVLIESFINKCRQFQIRKGLPDFLNPCNALKGEYGKSEAKTIEFTNDTLGMMKQLIASAENDRMRATFIVLCTSGMRAREICNARKSDIDGQVITLKDHKGIRYNTRTPKPAIAVMPKAAADIIERLNTDRPFISYRALHNAFHVRIRQGILPKGTIRHDFRNLIAEYWYQKGEEGMARFVLRCKAGEKLNLMNPLLNKMLKDKYVPPVTSEEACEKIKQLEEDLNIEK